MGKSYRLLVWLPESDVVKRNPQWLQTDCRELAKKHLILTKNPCIDSLIEIDPSLYGRTSAIELCSRKETEVADLGDDLLKARRGDDVVIHQGQIFLWAVECFDTLHNGADGVGIALIALKLRHSTKAALTNTPSRGISEICVRNRILVRDLVQDAVIRNQIFDWRSGAIIGIKLFRKIIELQRDCGRSGEQAFYKSYAAPTGICNESVMHERGRYSSYEDFISVTVSHLQRVVDTPRDPRKFERKKRCNVDAVPSISERRIVFPFYKSDAVAFAAWSVILRDFHEAKRRVFILVAWLDEEDILVSHSRPI